VSKLSECLKQVPSTTQVTHDFNKKKTSSKENLNNESKLKRRSQGTISQLAILRVQNNWGAKEGGKFKAIRCSTIILNVGFPDGDLTYLKKKVLEIFTTEFNVQAILSL
jgi:hypothetical protein